MNDFMKGLDAVENELNGMALIEMWYHNAGLRYTLDELRHWSIINDTHWVFLPTAKDNLEPIFSKEEEARLLRGEVITHGIRTFKKV
jgi:hypothetical protein